MSQSCRIRESKKNGCNNLLWKKWEKIFLSISRLRSPVGALRARSRFAAITGSKFCIESYHLLVSSQHVGTIAAVTIIGWIVSGWIVCIILAELSEFQIGWIVFGRIVWTRFKTARYIYPNFSVHRSKINKMK